MQCVKVCNIHSIIPNLSPIITLKNNIIQSNNAIEFTELYFVIITAINERSYTILHAIRVIYMLWTEIAFLVSRESLEIVSSNSTSGGFIYPVLNLRHIKIHHIHIGTSHSA